MIAIISRRILPPKELNTPGQRACYKSLLGECVILHFGPSCLVSVPESQEEFQQILGLYILSYYRDDSHEALDRRIVMQRVTSNIWRPTLKTLRESRFKATEQPVKEYILAVQLQDLAIKIWVDYGGKLGFREDVMEVLDSPSHQVRDPFWWKTSGCHWSGCLCAFGDRIHRMRVCKGCWKVLYCGTTCQRR